LSISTDDSLQYIEEAAGDLASRMWRHLPYPPSQDFTIEPRPILTITVSLDAITVAGQEKDAGRARVLLAGSELPKAIADSAIVTSSQISGYVLFGLPEFRDFSWPTFARLRISMQRGSMT
jgi:hypothetical protein